MIDPIPGHDRGSVCDFDCDFFFAAFLQLLEESSVSRLKQALFKLDTWT